MTTPEAGPRAGVARRRRLRVALLAGLEGIAIGALLVAAWLTGRGDGAIVLGLLGGWLCADLVVLSAIASGWARRRVLTNRVVVGCWLAACVGVGFVVLGDSGASRIGFASRGEKLIFWAVLSAAFARPLLLNACIASLRRKLRSQAERERLAEELHETVLQTFFGLVFRLTALAERLPADSAQRDALEAAVRDGEQALELGRAKVLAQAFTREGMPASSPPAHFVQARDDGRR